MLSQPSIRQLYQPLQPAISQRTTGVSYRELLPHPALRDLVYCYWELKTTAPLICPFTYRVVADGCTDIFTDLHNPQQSFIMGFCDRYTVFPLDPAFHYAGIRFLPGMFTQWSGIDAAALSQRSEALDAVLPATAAFLSHHLCGHTDLHNTVNRLDQHLLQLLSGKPHRYDGRFYEALLLILEQAGNLPVEGGLNTGISPRQLRRLFHYYIGDSAKTFSRVVRFQRLLQTCPQESLLREKAYFDLGYYDQAHFIKSFRQFYGLAPGQAAGI